MNRLNLYSTVRPRACRVLPRDANEGGALRDGLQGWREKVQDCDHANAEAVGLCAGTPVGGPGEAGQGVFAEMNDSDKKSYFTGQFYWD